MWQSSTHRKCQKEEVHLYKTDEKPNRRGVKQKRCKIAEVLACNKPKDDERIWRAPPTTIYKTKITTRKTEVWQSSTHRKCQSEEVHLYKTDEKPNRRGVKQKRCQIGKVQNNRGFGMQQTKRRRTDVACSTN